MATVSARHHVDDVRRALGALRHRGPDASGTWSAGSVCLGHARLAIVAPDDGAQPLFDESGQIAAVVSGEFYDHARLRRELEARGHRLRTRSDSELLVHLYEEQGDACLRQLHGEFAFVLWDARRRRLWAARDRFGVRPLLYKHDGEQLLLASEAKALFELGVRPSWDDDSLFVALGAHYAPPDRTLFRGIRQLEPGFALSFDEHGLRCERYWDLGFPTSTPAEMDLEEATRQVSAGLERAVQRRLVADVPLCVQLSGGLDSSLVAALAARQQTKPLACFVVSFNDERWDEAPRARESADWIGAELTELRLGRAELLSALPKAVKQAEGLAVNLHMPAKYLLSRAMSDAGYRVVLTGEGADEVFLGYAHFRQDAGVALEALQRGNLASAGLMLPEGDTLSLSGVTQRLGYVPGFVAAKASLGRRVRQLLRAEIAREHDARDPLLVLVDAAAGAGLGAGISRVDGARYLWMKTALASYILRCLGDAMEMAHSVEGRVPMLDHELFEAVRGMPLSVFVRGEREKVVLREVARGLLPPVLLERQKHPFVAPPSTLGPHADFRALVLDLVPRRLDFVDGSALEALLNRLDSRSERERVAWDPPLMLLLSAALLAEGYRL